MSGKSPVYASGLLVILACLTACETDQSSPPQAAAETWTRPAVDALDKRTADARHARVSNVSYELVVDLTDNDRELVGEVRIRFDLSDDSSDLTLDFTGGTLSAVMANDTAISPAYNGYFITLPQDALRVGPNVIEIAYSRPFGNDGTGLHRFVDPVDDRVYLHSYLWPYYANRILPAFDQPSLKAHFNLSVKAPADWVVVSTMPGTSTTAPDGAALWEFPETPLISTYFFSLHAGEYAIWSDDSGNVPLRLFARQSLAEFVAVDEWFELTQNGMTFFEEYFDIPYPFEKYDQLIVPEFNIGGMENAAAVSYSERYVQRQASKHAERESRAGTILHELAHMWFGDLVTHHWWNGMWLNESFATQMETLALMETTEFDDQWHAFFIKGKNAAYERDSRVTTHPVEMPVASTAQFSELFDDITYEKGGSVLKQLMYRVGPENYRQGVSNYLKEHAWGTTELEDFIGHQSRISGADLSNWSEEWLLTPGFNTLAASATCEDDKLMSVSLTQTAPPEYPAIRTHQLDVALYDFAADGRLVVYAQGPIVLDEEREALEYQGVTPCPALINPNADDWTYAKIDISAEEIAFLTENLAAIADPLSRSMFLRALFDTAMAGDMPIADYVRVALRLADTEQSFRILQQITGSLASSVHMMQRLSPETDAVLPRLLDDIEVLGLKRAEYAETQDLKRLWFGLFTSVASSPAALGTSRALLDGKTTIAGLDMSADIRWQLLTILNRNNAAGVDALLAAEIQKDPSDRGQRQLLSARAAAPDAANKEFWIDELQSPAELSTLARQRAVMSTLFPATHTDTQLALLDKILSVLPRMSREADSYFLSSYTSSMLKPMCRDESSAVMQAALDDFGAELNPTALRFLREAHQADVECTALRSAQ